MRSSAIIWPALLALGACASTDDRWMRDLASVHADLHERTGVSPARETRESAEALLVSPVDADEAVRAALALDPRVRELVADLGVASAERVRAGLLRNPMLEFDAMAFSSGTELGLNLTQPLFDLVTLDARRDIADAGIEAARAGTVRALVRIVYDVRRAWTELRASDHELALMQERLAAEEAAARLARVLHAAGNVTDAILTDAELGLADAQEGLSRARGRTRASRERLARRIGISTNTPAIVISSESGPEELRELLDDHLESAALRASLDLRESEARIAALARAAGVAQWNVLLDSSSAGLVAARDDGESGLGAELTLPLALFDSGAAAGSQAARTLEAALAEHARREHDVSSVARSLVVRYDTARELALLARDQHLPLARKSVLEMLQQYNAMQVGVFDVLAARRVEFDAAMDAIESERAAEFARLDLQELLAGSMPAHDQDDSTDGSRDEAAEEAP